MRVQSLPIIRAYLKQAIHKQPKPKPAQLKLARAEYLKRYYCNIFIKNFRLRKKMKLILE